MHHTLRLELKGSSGPILKASEFQLDIADEFKRFGCALGFEDPRSSYSRVLALWETACLYNQHSLLEGDFLARGLHLDLTCSANRPIPYAEILLCLQGSLRQIAACELMEITLILNPYSRKQRRKLTDGRADFGEFMRLADCPAPTAHGNFSFLTYRHFDNQGKELATGKLQVPPGQYLLAETAPFFIALWAGRLKNVVRKHELVQISLK